MSRLDFRSIAEAKAQARGDLLRALAGMPADVPPEPEAPRMPSLDGGARKTPEVPETHGQTLVRVLAERRADVGRSFGI
jgi:hypothetical protein